MASRRTSLAPVCDACKNITFVDLCGGFDHPLPYDEAVMSARTCKFCRLMVCSFSRLQVEANIYEVNNNYDQYIPQLLRNPMIARFCGPLQLTSVSGSEYPLQECFRNRPDRLSWQVLPGMSPTGVVNGCFNDGATIQINAPEGSSYLAMNLIATREIYDANCERNNNLLYCWLQDCISFHPQCGVCCTGEILDETDLGGVILPSRVIDVGPPNGSVPARLFITTPGQKGSYVALSHRWGTSHKITTISANLSTFQDRLPMEQLPKTFQDAIAVTRRLAEQYLWIDSLCIIQDDADDWEHEAKQMGSIFEHAICTIAAIDGIDNDSGQDQGLFIPRCDDPLSVRLDCSFDDLRESPPGPDDPCYEDEDTGESTFQLLPFSEDITHNEIVLRPRWKGLHFNMLDTDWNARGWILQERLLSRRMIYYTKRKIFWQCNTLAADEENIINEPFSIKAHFTTALMDFAKSLQNGENLGIESFSFWWNTVADYTQCKLTKTQDKLVALAGLCERVQTRIGRPLFAGMLEDPSGINLLWRANSQTEHISPAQFHAPSWSWASCPGPVIYSSSEPMLEPITTLCLSKNIQFTMETQCLEPGVTPGSRCVRGSHCGILSFTAPSAMAYACEYLDETGWESNAELIEVLGSAVHREQIAVPRLTEDGITHTPKRCLRFPPQTRLLRNRNNNIIGWLIPDKKLDSKGLQVPINCVAIMQHTASQQSRKPLIGKVHNFEYRGEQLVDILALKQNIDQQKHFVRIGLGQIVRKGWLESCKESTFTVQ